MFLSRFRLIASTNVACTISGLLAGRFSYEQSRSIELFGGIVGLPEVESSSTTLLVLVWPYKAFLRRSTLSGG
ncbi:hypothetical protein Tco_0988388 [Tanacetum coccineum]|uniref:Uncharacterized protein n=1 Tax=Tanacetum coccineum TaxID=301880 RepID=A0ABQ5ER63_9ASTR